jgi:hypothetical protein
VDPRPWAACRSAWGTPARARTPANQCRAVFRPLLPLALQPRTNWSPTNWGSKIVRPQSFTRRDQESRSEWTARLGEVRRNPFQLWSTTGARTRTPGLPFWSGHVSAYLGPRSANLSSKPNAVAPLTILDRVARPEPAVETCPAQLVLISGAAGHFGAGSARAQSPHPAYCPSAPRGFGASTRLCPLARCGPSVALRPISFLFDRQYCLPILQDAGRLATSVPIFLMFFVFPTYSFAVGAVRVRIGTRTPHLWRRADP